MAQLRDDCFAPGEGLMPMDDALAILAERIVPVVAEEQAPLRAARGRILAEDVVAAEDVPRHDNSAVDGYAFSFADLGSGTETRFAVKGRATAGHPFAGPLRRGAALRIFTGAEMPAGLDTVAMQEDCTESGGSVTIPAGLECGANRRLAGEDVVSGHVVLHKGQRLRPQDIGIAATVGRGRLSVFRRLRVAVFSTGDEVVDPGEALPRGAVYDANRYTLGSMTEALGAKVTDLGILPDDLDTVRTALEKAASDHDLLITSGGVSVGEEDHVRSAVEAIGRLHFWRLAIKPGRPLAMGQIGSVPFVGIPGNPVAAMVTFLRFVRPLILQLGGADAVQPFLFKVRAGFDHRKKANRREWIRARLVRHGDGTQTVEKFPREGAGILSSMVEADGLVELPEDLTQLEKGSEVDFLPFSEVL
ncbi:MAG: molybdopterin molybdotransferase MoeA [Proteobacteria bacterium]|nr:molybdopterin molybdotransferase MoeA [Pseudomonadota bacterium]